MSLFYSMQECRFDEQINVIRSQREQQEDIRRTVCRRQALRDRLPRKAHGEWRPAKNRRDPVEMILASEKGRLPELLPLRHGRMVRSAFTFYRGAATHDGRRPLFHTIYRYPGPVLRRCSSLQFWWVCNARTEGHPLLRYFLETATMTKRATALSVFLR